MGVPAKVSQGIMPPCIRVVPCAEALVFQMLTSRQRKGSSDDMSEALLTVRRQQRCKGIRGWKVVMCLENESGRHYGTWRPTIVETVGALLEAYSHRIVAAERERAEDARQAAARDEARAGV